MSSLPCRVGWRSAEVEATLVETRPSHRALHSTAQFAARAAPGSYERPDGSPQGARQRGAEGATLGVLLAIHGGVKACGARMADAKSNLQDLVSCGGREFAGETSAQPHCCVEESLGCQTVPALHQNSAFETSASVSKP